MSVKDVFAESASRIGVTYSRAQPQKLQESDVIEIHQ